MFTRDVIRKVEKMAADLKVEAADLLAVAEVESGGTPIWKVGSKNRPAIRFEGHYFYRKLKGAKLKQAISAGLASPKAGTVKNPGAYKARYDMLERAAKIDRRAAYESTSWGLGQVMGDHWRKLGYASIDEFVATAERGIDGQIEIMSRFIAKFGLVDELQNNGWADFARQYNGKNYRVNRYDTKMAKAYSKWKKALAGGANTVEEAETSVNTDTVAGIQRNLAALGYYKGRVDGIEGPRTKAAIRAFQKAQGLVADGKYGKMTDEAMDRALVKAGRKTGNDAVKTGTGCTGVGVATDIVATQAEKLESVSHYSDIIGYIVAVLVIGGVALALWGLWKKYKTGTLEEESV